MVTQVYLISAHLLDFSLTEPIMPPIYPKSCGERVAAHNVHLHSACQILE